MPTADQHSEFFVRTLTGIGVGQGNYVGFIPFEYGGGREGVQEYEGLPQTLQDKREVGRSVSSPCIARQRCSLEFRPSDLL